MERVKDLILSLPSWICITLVAHFLVLGTVAYLILLERKVASWVQDRIGPNRVGLGFGIIPVIKNMHMFGLGQPLADGLKFIVKEDYAAKNVDKVLFTVAPFAMIIAIILSIATVPMGGIKEYMTPGTVIVERDLAASTAELPPSVNQYDKSAVLTKETTVSGQTHQIWTVSTMVPARYNFQIADLNIGVLFILAVLSLAVYGVVIGGWASNNKYSFLGGLRATANMISYEIPLGLVVLCIVIMFGTLNLETIVEQQAGYWAGFIPAWNVFSQPLAFVMFLICIHAEANRAPFDMAEAEQELVGGYHTEYSSMRFALFFLAEYAGMITTSAVMVCLFFGGWQVPGLDRLVVTIINHVAPHAGAFVDTTNPAVTNSVILCVIRAMVVFGKTIVVIFVFMWTRWSLPRFRFDQLMMLAWRALIPISLALLVMTALVVYFFPPNPTSTLMIDGYTALVLFTANVILLIVIMAVSMFLPAAPLTNRKTRIAGGRYNRPLARPAVVSV